MNGERRIVNVLFLQLLPQGEETLNPVLRFLTECQTSVRQTVNSEKQKMNFHRKLVLHPLFLIALLLLIFNDHFLKIAYPSLLTGKLSDFAGIFTFPIFVAVLFHRFIQNQQRFLILHLIIVILFTMWKLAPVEILLQYIGQTTSLPMPKRVKDATDLTALSVLPLSYYFVIYQQKRRFNQFKLKGLQNLLCTIVLFVASSAFIATSYHYQYLRTPNRIVKTNMSKAELLYNFEKALFESGIEIAPYRVIGDSLYIYNISLEYSRNIDDNNNISQHYSIHGKMNVRIDFQELIIKSIKLETRNVKYAEEIIDKIIDEKIMAPFVKKNF